MNKIYLFLIALLATVGFTAKADDGMTVKGNFKSSTSNWQSYDMSWNGDDDSKGYRQKVYRARIYMENKRPEMLIMQGNTNIGAKVANGTIKEGTGNGETVTASSNHIKLSEDLQLNTYYYVYIYYNTSNNNGNVGSAANGNDHWVEIVKDSDQSGNTETVDPSDGYYFYGDMNRWSLTQNNGQQVSIKGGDGTTYKIEDVFEAPYPKYYTQKELESMWMFKPVDAAHAWSSGSISAGSGWYYLDFSKLYDGDGNKGRLCGQFKITKGYYKDDNQDNWGTELDDAYPSLDYLNTQLTTGTSAFSLKKGTGKQNIVLSNNYVVAGDDKVGPILYFHPANNQMKLRGKGVDCYVYYAIAGGNATVADVKDWLMSDGSQENYYMNTIGFNGKVTTEKNRDGFPLANYDQKVDPTKYNPNNAYFKWEVYTNGGQGVIHNKVKFNQVVRRRIPSGASHRYPIEVNVWVKDANKQFEPQRVMCDDVWFIDATKQTVNVYFRYDDVDATKTLDWASYNIFNTQLDQNGVVNGYNYLFGGVKKRNETQPKITEGEYAVMQLVENVELSKIPDEYKSLDSPQVWWKSPIAIPSEFASNSWVIFGESRGGIYPVDRVKADFDVLNEMGINGQDLFFVAKANENPTILYSHLNGTFKRSDSVSKTVQINAEFFDPETFDSDTTPTLVTHTGEVKYRFEIYYNGEIKATSSVKNDDGYHEEPFWNWDMNSPEWVPGYYYVIVKALYKGNIYTAQDTYAVY